MAELLRRDARCGQPLLERLPARLLAPHLFQVVVDFGVRRRDAARPGDLRREMVLDDPVEDRAHQLVALSLRHRVQRRDRDLADGRLDLPPFDRLVADARDDCRELARNRRCRRRLGLVFTGRGRPARDRDGGSGQASTQG